MAKQDRNYPSIATTISPKDLGSLEEIRLKLSNKYQRSITRSEVIRSLIRYADKHRDELWENLEDQTLRESYEEERIENQNGIEDQLDEEAFDRGMKEIEECGTISLQELKMELENDPANEETKKQRITVQISEDVIERVKNAVYWTPGLTLASLAEEALDKAVDRLERDRKEPFAKREEELKTGRPIKCVPAISDTENDSKNLHKTTLYLNPKHYMMLELAHLKRKIEGNPIDRYELIGEAIEKTYGEEALS